MKKILSLFIGAIISFGILTFSVSAAEYAVSYPSDGSQITVDELEKIEFSAPEGTECSVFLDGDLLRKNENENFVLLPEPVSIGNHCIELFTPEGRVVSEFTATEKRTTESCFNDFKNADINADTLGKYGTAVMMYDGTTIFGKDIYGNPAEMKQKAFAGIDGDEKGAVGWFMGNGLAVREVPNSRSNTITYKDDATGDLGLNDGNICIEYDLEVFAKCDFSIETRFKKSDGTHDWASFGGMILNADGTISVSSDEYKIGEGNWMHIKHIVNVDTKTEKLYVDDKLYLNDTPFTLNGKLNSIKLQYFIRNSEDGQGFAVDNFKVLHEKFYGSFQDLSYSVEKSGAFKRAAGNTVSADSVRLRLKNDLPLIDASDLTEYSSLTADGMQMKLESVKTDSDGYLRVVLKNGLPENADIVLRVSDGETKYINIFKTEKPSLLMSNAAFKAEDAYIYFKESLVGKNKITLFADFKNTAMKSQNGVLIVNITDGGRIEKTEAINITVPSGESSVAYEAELSSDYEEPNVEIFFIDSWENYSALSRLYLLN